MGLQNNFCNFKFFSRKFFKPHERARQEGYGNQSLTSQMLTLDLKKNLECSKIDRKSFNSQLFNHVMKAMVPELLTL